MPVNLSIRDVPDDIAARLRARAKRNHRSLQGELMALLEDATSTSGFSDERREFRGSAPERTKLTTEEIIARAKKRGPLRTEREQKEESVAEMVRHMRDERTEHILRVLGDTRRK